MRDPNRIDRIIELLRSKWKDNPDLRLCQLLENVARNTLRYQGESLFYIEDNSVEKGLAVYPGALREE